MGRETKCILDKPILSYLILISNEYLGDKERIKGGGEEKQEKGKYVPPQPLQRGGVACIACRWGRGGLKGGYGEGRQ